MNYIYNSKKKFDFIKNNINHIAIIMDGNRRWAINKNKSYIDGHKAGVKAVKKIIKYSIICNLKVLTLYAFSSENLNRSKQEVESLINLFLVVLNSDLDILYKNNIKLRIIGDISLFGSFFKNSILHAHELTKLNTGLLLNIAINYGGRWDIIQGIKKLISKIKYKKISSESINENYLSKFLCIDSKIPVDLVIRTGGEYRISNFMLWQIAYSELYFTNTLWPDFNEHSFQLAIKEFLKRDRRFGGS
ncbi:Ditrans,polycis-undecaprenyl-diphosphate synthase ((2E,6E)-farnesyl-diphosphate specific) [Buchnera aphidicola (Neophyllaphis podocarpi)]|uniref:polyprenyl diphosphate synthase n=1 Tax=Buchnera aphidicola TaxID=9 RepID=UPI003463B34E